MSRPDATPADASPADAPLADTPPVDTDDANWAAWFAAARDATTGGRLSTALHRLYADLETELARHDGRCDQSGRCCRFESFGHRLYVTGLETAWFLTQAAPRAVPAGPTSEATADPLHVLPAAPSRDACVFQIDGLCGQHRIRPLGCRAFFCGGAGEGWQEAAYEAAQAELIALHERLRMPYRYGEWRALLAEADAFRRASQQR